MHIKNAQETVEHMEDATTQQENADAMDLIQKTTASSLFALDRLSVARKVYATTTLEYVTVSLDT